MKKFSGVGVALITPFNDNGTIDYTALSNVMDHVIVHGADYLVALGTTAESATLSAAEKNDIVRFIVERNGGRVPVVVGIGGNNTREVAKAVQTADLGGVDGILSVTPYYNKPSQKGLFEHFKAIAENAPLPVILYNVPGRTGVNMAPETTIALARNVGNIAAIKEACTDIFQINHLLKYRPAHFSVLTGDDAMAFPFAAMGGDGVISVAANAFPEEFCRMFREAKASNLENGRNLAMRLYEVIDALFEDGNPSGVKAALHIKGFIRNRLRLPLVPVNEHVYQKIKTYMKDNNL